MSNTHALSESAIGAAHAGKVGMKLEIVVILDSDVDCTNCVRGDLGRKLGIDGTTEGDYRRIQFAPVGRS